MDFQEMIVAKVPVELVTLCLGARPVRSYHSGDMISSPGDAGLFKSGRRNTDMASMAGGMRRRGASQQQIEEFLLVINKNIPLPLSEDEVMAIARSVSRYEILPCGFTHDEVAKLFCRDYQGRVKYCPGKGFYVYDGKRWIEDTEGLKVLALFRELVDAVNADIIALSGKIETEQYEKLKKAGNKLRGADFMRNVLKLAKSDDLFMVGFDVFDKDKNLINFSNGTYDLAAKSLRPHSSSDNITYMLPFEYDEKADCPAFKKMLADILQEDKANFILRVFGYVLTGTGREQKFFIFHGKGKNGKSTLLQAVVDVLGEFTINVQPETLNGKMEGHIRNDLARLPGKRLMTTNETRAGNIMDAPLLKQITGGDELSVRFLHQEYFQFRPVCVPVITSNHLPVFDGSDHAMERRICLVTFDRMIENVDHQLSEKLRAERAGIFNILLQGMEDYQGNGLSIPASVQKQTQVFVDRSNLMKGFFQDKLEVEDGGKVKASDLYSAYMGWCAENGYRPMSTNTFKDSFERETGLEQMRSSEGRYWSGLRLRR